jgi:hypothetical protein
MEYISLNVQDGVNNKLKYFQYVCGTIKVTVDTKQGEITQLKFCKTRILSCLMYGSETWTDERRLEAAEIAVPTVCTAGYTVWDNERSDRVRSQLGMRKLDKQIHEKKKKLAGAPT